MAWPGTVFIVDDEPEIRRSLERLLHTENYETRAFGSALDFLTQHEPDQAGCILLDVAMPGIDGLQLQQHLAAAGLRRPIIFISGRSDIPKSVRAMKAGAVNFLTKPVDAGELLAAVQEALAVDAAWRAECSNREAAAALLATLTRRERQVLEKVIAGRLNKQIAAELGTVEKTIKVHRSRVMRKMRAGSLPELVQLAQLAGVVVDSGPIVPQYQARNLAEGLARRSSC